MTTVRRWLRRGGASLLAAALLLTACADQSGGPAATTDGTEVDDLMDPGDGPTDGGDPGDTGTEDGEPPGVLPRFVTEQTPDGRYAMSVDGSATLELRQDTASPAVTGTAPEVIDVSTFADAGVAQWEIRAIEPGDTTITATVDGRQRVWTITVRD